MEAIDKIRNFIENLETKDFYKYLAIALSVIIVIIGILIFNFYRKIHNLNERIALINDQRIVAQRILTQDEQVKKQRIAVNAILAQDPDFIIGNYFNKILTKLGLIDKQKSSIEVSHIEHGDGYKETILKAKLTDMNMKQLCDLLSEIEKTERVYPKELEIVKGKNKTIDVNLAIATLEPKEKQKV